MDKRFLATGSFVLFLAVGLGAFGAHGLKSVVAPHALDQWKTGVEYQFYHGLGILLLAGLSQRGYALRWAYRAFVVGLLLFCGSVYLLSIRELLGIMECVKVLGPITPIGGLCFLAGWAILFINVLRTPDHG